MAAVTEALVSEDCGDDERPLTALPMFGNFVLFAYADGRAVGVDSSSGAVRLRDEELPCREQIFGAERQRLGAVPRFDQQCEGAEAVAAFKSAHLDTFEPALLPGLARSWPAVGKWDFAFFANTCGDVDVDVTMPDGKRQVQRLAEYISQIQASNDVSAAHAVSSSASAQPYLRGWYYERDAPWLASDLWAPGDFHEVAFADWFKRLPKRYHPDFHWIFLGGAGATTPLHVDPTTTHAWLTQISGRKRFILFDPRDLPRLLRTGEAPGRGVLVSIEEALSMGVPCLDVVLEPGDTLFVPAFWPHYVECLDESVSLTWNFLGKELFPLVRAAFMAHQFDAPARSSSPLPNKHAATATAGDPKVVAAAAAAVAA